MVTTETGQIETRIAAMVARCETPDCGWTYREDDTPAVRIRYALLSVQANGHELEHPTHHVAEDFEVVTVPRAEYGRYIVKVDRGGVWHRPDDVAALTDARITSREITQHIVFEKHGDKAISVAAIGNLDAAQRIARALMDADERATWAVHSAFTADDIGTMPGGFGYPSHPGTHAERDEWLRKHADQVRDAMTVTGFETIAELLHMEGIAATCDECGHAKHAPGECEHQTSGGADPRAFETCGCDAGEEE